jgi:hypothetical protein
MLSRTLTLAAVTLLIGCFAADQSRAQVTNLEAGKSPSQIFAGTCTACHKAPRGLLKTVPGSSLQSFLRQHYTTSPEMASLLAGFLISNGAADTRYGAGQSKPGNEKLEARPPSGVPDQLDRFGRRIRPATQEATRPEGEPRQVAKPDADGPLPESGRYGRNGRRLARPGEVPTVEGQPADVVNERGPDGRRLSSQQRLSKRGRPGAEDSPKSEAGKTDAGVEAAKSELSKPEGVKDEPVKSEARKDDGQAASETAKTESPSKTESSKPESSKTEPSNAESAKNDAAKNDVVKGGNSNGESSKVESGPSGGAKPAVEEGKSEAARTEAAKASGELPGRPADSVPVTPAPVPAVSATAASGGTLEPVARSPVAAAVGASPAVTGSAMPPIPAGPPAPPISQ